MPQKVADHERKSPESSDSGDFWWRLLDSNQWPHACEDSIGPSSAGFWENKAGLSRVFITRRYSPFHCFRPGFSVRGSRRGSKRDPRFLFAPGKALSCSIDRIYAELGKMQSGAVAKTAVGHSLEKGGDAVGTRTMDEGPSFFDLFSHGPLDHGLHSPKSVLTARRPPSG